jgi:spore maturation protein CgeB
MQAINAAAGTTAGSMESRDYGLKFSAWNTLAPDGGLGPTGDGPTAQGPAQVRVEVPTLDGVATARGLVPGFIKIDAWNFETEVLDSASQVLQSARPTLLLKAGSPRADRLSPARVRSSAAAIVPPERADTRGSPSNDASPAQNRPPMKAPSTWTARAKDALRTVPGAAALNAAWRGRATLAAYRQLARHYAARPQAPPLPRLDAGDRRPRILFIGTDEAQDRSGFIQALERVSDLVLFTRADGAYGHNDTRAPEVRRAANRDRLLDLLSGMEAADRRPDIVLAQSWATLIDPSAFDAARRMGACVVNLSLDDRHQFRGRRESFGWSGTLGLVGHIDLALTAAPECVQWYEAEGCPALYFPEASDPDIFHPIPGLPKLHEVSFVGGRYGIRERTVGALRRAGIEVAAFGSGWEGGRIDNEAMIRLFVQSKVVLGVGTIGHCTDFFALKLRDFDAPMCGSAYLTHDNPDLAALYDIGRDIATYRDIDECVDRARALLADDDAREDMARAGRARALRDHTWDRRFGELFRLLGVTA